MQMVLLLLEFNNIHVKIRIMVILFHLMYESLINNSCIIFIIKILFILGIILYSRLALSNSNFQPIFSHINFCVCLFRLSGINFSNVFHKYINIICLWKTKIFYKKTMRSTFEYPINFTE